MRKKYQIIAICLLFSVLLVSCANRNEQENSSSSTNIEKSTSSTFTSVSSSEQKTVTLLSLNIDSLMQGNYDSIIGIWQNNQGDQLIFNTKGFVSEDQSLIGRGKISEGIFETGYVDKHQGESELLMVPANVVVTPNLINSESDLSDITKDRMIIKSDSFDEDVDVYYRVLNSGNSDIDPLSNKETGVILESGPKTIEYANQILGENNWKVFEGNYTRTESIPYNILEGNDGIRYTIYQNGVIINANYQIVYQP